MEYLFSALLGFLSGSIPFAFLVMKKTKGVDLTSVGSGNVGAMNSYEISGSKSLGFLVFFLDALKGIIPILILMIIYRGSFILSCYWFILRSSSSLL
jgi:acyl phosphate:glycerol-3-phosphate acyltransferase